MEISISQRLTMMIILFLPQLISAQDEFKTRLTRRVHQGSGSSVAEQQLIHTLLGEGGHRSVYDWRIRPQATRKDIHVMEDPDAGPEPVLVFVNMYLRTISKVDDVNMEYSLHFTFREEWQDSRLWFSSHKLSYVNLAPGQKIWMPDTFFQNEKEGKKHDIDTPNVLLRVYNGTGKVLYSVRMTLTLSCPMSLHNYPMDFQECYVEFASYAYTTDDIDYLWKACKPYQLKAGLRQSLPSFTLSHISVGNCTSSTNTGTYSCLKLLLVLKREFSYYMLQLYIPSFMLVAVSWVSFWLDKDSVPARVTLGVTTLLTMTTQASGVNAKLPPVSYTKAIDVWIGVCLAFIFGALLEFALINYAARRDMMEQSRSRATTKERKLTAPVPAYNPLVVENPVSGSAYCRLQTNNNNSTHPMASHSLMDDYNVGGDTAYIMPPTIGGGILGNGRSLALKPYSHRHATLTSGRWWQFGGGRKGGPPPIRNSAKKIDMMSRVVFPCTFIIFNIFYWTIYLMPYIQTAGEFVEKQRAIELKDETCVKRLN